MMKSNSDQIKILEKILDECRTRSLRICQICILRFLNIKHVFTLSDFDKLDSFYQNYFEDKFITSVNGLKDNLCDSCLDLLKDGNIQEISGKICEHISNKLPSFQMKDFQIHISFPLILTLRHLYFSNIFQLDQEFDVIHVKDVLKTFLCKQVENLLHSQHSINSFHVIALNFTHQESQRECETLLKTYEKFCIKRSKSNLSNSFINHTSLMRLFDQMNLNSLDAFELTRTKLKCDFVITTRKEPVYLAGRYMKYARNLSQTPWFNEDRENHVVSSVQERIYSGISKFIKFSDTKFSSSGREDVDVRMLGKGRPFMFELINPEWSISDGVIEKIKQFINQTYQDVNVRDLQFVPKFQSQLFLKMGEQEKSKTYQALCCLDRPFTEDDARILNSVENLIICQKTPIRVLHRRTLSDRKRTIHKISIVPINLEELEPKFNEFITNLFNMTIITEAGTYIKEFVHSDFGRTSPSIGKLLVNCQADIIHLDVMEVTLDWPPTVD